MKQKFTTLSSAAVTLLATVSCVEIGHLSDPDSLPSGQPEANYVIYAQIAGTGTKTALENGGAVTWNLNDEIKVAQSKSVTASDALCLFRNTAPDAADAVFEGEKLPASEGLVAIFPADAYLEETASGSIIDIPSVQYAVAGGFPVHAAEQGKSINPSYAYCEGADEQGELRMTFHNIGGLLGFELPAYLENITEIVLESTTAALTGEFTLALEAGRASLSGKSTSGKLTLRPTLAEQVFRTGVVYYASLAPVDTKGVTITLKTHAGGSFVKHSATFPLALSAGHSGTLALSKVVKAPAAGDYFLYDGTWAPRAEPETEGMVRGKRVAGYIISTDNQIVEDYMETTDYSLAAKLAERPGDYFHGYVIAKKISSSMWSGGMHDYCNSRLNNWLASHADAYTYWAYRDDTIFAANHQETVNFNKFRGYVNCCHWAKKEISLTNAALMPDPVRNTSGWYVPSTGEMRNMIVKNKALFQDKIGFSGDRWFWTSSICHKGTLQDWPISYHVGSDAYEMWTDCTKVYDIVYLLAF